MDKVCAVFGGSRGIGRAVAQLMARKGYRLAVIARNLDGAKAAAGDLGGFSISRVQALSVPRVERASCRNPDLPRPPERRPRSPRGELGPR
ncbi:hypothetical protein P7K49_005686, partial [Saguinus oedipus]